MANPRFTASSVQTVHRGSAGASLRLTDAYLQSVRQGGVAASARVGEAFAQVVHQGSTGSEVGVSSATLQVVTITQAGRLRVTEAFAQVVHRGDGGAMIRETTGALQVVYTTGVADSSRQRAWTFDFDGHSFYVLDLATSGALLYDLTTGQWTRFETAGYGGVWDFRNGFHWRTGKMVVGGATDQPVIRKLTPESFVDEGWRPIQSEVRGLLPVGGIEYRRQYTLRLVGAAGQLSEETTPILRMQFSDDQGVSWSAEHTITLVPDTRQRIEFRSLGAFTAPGRIFRLYDEGGIKFLAYVEAEIGGEDAATPA